MQLGRIQLAEGPLDGNHRNASRFCVRVSGVDVPLRRGETLIGRADECQIRVNDGLVSRRHARIMIEGDAAIVEDLGSTNGIFVNQKKVEGKAPLSPGDHLFVGTCELVFGERLWEDDALTDSGVDPVEKPADRPTPVSDVEVVAPPAAADSARFRGDLLATDQPTTTVGTFEYFGHLADKMFTMGRVDAAQRILGSHLNEVLEAARRGDALDPALVDKAGKYSVKLATETLDGRWIDLVLELHTIAARPLRAGTVQQLALLYSKAPLGKRHRLHRYIEVLKSRIDAYSAAERVLIERIACLNPDDDPER